MADCKSFTGSRDDVRIDASRCLRMRFSGSGCSRCVDVCPHGAITVDGGLSLDPEQCRGCLLCTSICPVGALEQRTDFTACLEQLSRVPEPILGCIRTQEHSNAKLACLGGLAEEHLLALCHTLTGSLILNLSLCPDCTNNAIIPHLRQCLATLCHAEVFAGGCSLVLTESAQDIRCCFESVDRRSFFKLVRSSLFKGAAVVLSVTDEQPEQSTAYGMKRLPVRRELLNRIRVKLPPGLAVVIGKYFDFRVNCGDACTKCQSCVAICPTGALQTGTTDASPVFERLSCTGCGLCQEFCMEETLRIQPGHEKSN